MTEHYPYFVSLGRLLVPPAILLVLLSAERRKCFLKNDGTGKKSLSSPPSRPSPRRSRASRGLPMLPWSMSNDSIDPLPIESRRLPQRSRLLAPSLSGGIARAVAGAPPKRSRIVPDQGAINHLRRRSSQALTDAPGPERDQPPATTLLPSAHGYSPNRSRGSRMLDRRVPATGLEKRARIGRHGVEQTPGRPAESGRAQSGAVSRAQSSEPRKLRLDRRRFVFKISTLLTGSRHQKAGERRGKGSS